MLQEGAGGAEHTEFSISSISIGDNVTVDVLPHEVSLFLSSFIVLRSYSYTSDEGTGGVGEGGVGGGGGGGGMGEERGKARENEENGRAKRGAWEGRR